MPATVIPPRPAPFAVRLFVTDPLTDTLPAGSETSFRFDPERQVTVDADGRPRTHAGTITMTSGKHATPPEVDEGPHPKPKSRLW